jgi:predicted branched-subunit amino acid permease
MVIHYRRLVRKRHSLYGLSSLNVAWYIYKKQGHCIYKAADLTFGTLSISLRKETAREEGWWYCEVSGTG